MKSSVKDSAQSNKVHAVIMVAAHSEWQAVKNHFNEPSIKQSPFGESFSTIIDGHRCVFLQGGWGKVSAAAATQYAIDHWQPQLILNLGTCGGFEGRNKVGEIVLADETIIYDIHERMGDPEAARRFYASHIDLSWLRQPLPNNIRVGLIASADEDIDPALVQHLVGHHQAIAADWESGAIAWVAQRNRTRVLILRVVSDLVGSQTGELYGEGDFNSRSLEVMPLLVRALPDWLERAFQSE